MMIKNGKIEIGKTPSEVSGKKSETFKKGAAARIDEKVKRTERDLKVPLDHK